MEMLLLGLHPDEPYLPFGGPRDRPWWAYEINTRAARSPSRPRRILGQALIRVGQAVAAEHRATAIG
jgi:hypothetical protein